MGSITGIKLVLTQKTLKIFCETYHIPDEVHPQLPGLNQTIREMPTGKIGVYTRFFEYANFQLPLSTFLVNVLRHYRIHISQLSVIGAAKVSHFEILCRVHGFEPMVGLFHYFYVNSKNKGWMSLSKRPGNDVNSSKSVSKDPFSQSSKFNAEHYATIVAYPAPFHKYPELFLCLVGIIRHYTLDENTYPEFLRDDDEEMDLLSFIRIADPTKVRIGERQCDEDEPRLLETTVGRVVPLLPAEHGDSADGGDGQDTDVQPVTTSADTIAEDVTPLQPRRQRKRKTDVVDAGGSSHPPMKLKEDHGTLGEPSVAHSSHHSGANIAEAEVDSFVRPSVLVITAATTVTLTVDLAVVVKEKIVKPSVFVADSSSAGGVDLNAGVFLDLTGSDFLVSGVRTVIDPEFDLQKVYVPRWSVTNGSRLDDGRVCREMVDEFAPPKFFPSIRGMDHDQLFTEFNVWAARQISLSAEVRMHAEYNIKEKRRLKTEVEAAEAIRLRAEVSNFEVTEKSLRDEVNALNGRNLILKKERNALDVKVTDLAASVKVREQEVANLDDVVTSVKFQNDSLVKQVHEPETSSAVLQEKIYADFIEMTLHLEERFYPHLLTTIAGRRWLLTYGIELAIAKCLNSPEYLSALGAAISKAIEKGMQDGLAAGITHGKEGRVLADVAAYNPSAEVDYASALQQLQSVNFSLLAELKLNKDSSVETLMNILRLEDTLAARLGLNESQSHVDQLMVPIHHSPDQNVIGATALSLSLDVSHARKDLEGTGGTSGTVHATADTTTVLSMFVASTGTVMSISIDDYEVVGADDLATADGNVIDEDTNPFPNVDDVELNVPE
ncbi:hypothetical protein Tco_0595364 [Tanacetum coccineum]